MADSSHLCSGPARQRGGMIRAITMETPPTPQAPEEGWACSLFHCALREEKWLVNPASSNRKRGLFIRSAVPDPPGSLCMQETGSHVAAILPAIIQSHKLSIPGKAVDLKTAKISISLADASSVGSREWKIRCLNACG